MSGTMWVHPQDPDLRELRDRREWIDAMTVVKGGMSREMKNDLRSEAKVSNRGMAGAMLSGALMVIPGSSQPQPGLATSGSAAFGQLPSGCLSHLTTPAPSQAPFRFPRLVVLGGIGISAAIGLVIITGRLIASIKGEHVIALQRCCTRGIGWCNSHLFCVHIRLTSILHQHLRLSMLCTA